MNYTSATGSSVHQTVSLIMVAKSLDVIIGQLTMETMNKMVEQMAQIVAPVKTTAWEGHHGSLALVLDDQRSLPPSHSINQITSIKVSRHYYYPPWKYSPSKKKRRNFKRNLTCRRQSPSSACNASSTASKKSTSKNSTKNISVTPTAPSKVPNQLVQGHYKGTH